MLNKLTLVIALIICSNCYSQSTDSAQFIMADSVIGSFYRDAKGEARTIVINKNKTYSHEHLWVTRKPAGTWLGHWYLSKDTLILVEETLVHPDGKTYSNDGKVHYDKFLYKNNSLYATYGFACYVRLKPESLSATTLKPLNKKDSTYFCEKTYDGIITKEGFKKDDLLIGEIRFYEQGKLINVFTYVDDVPNGFYSAYYFPSGNIYVTGNFKDGKKDGVFKEYDINGKLISTKKYRDDEQIE